MTIEREGDDGVTVPIVCTECDTDSRIPLDDVGDALERHNERFHDGEPIAEVDPAVKETLADLIAEEMGLFEGDGEFP